MLEENLNYFCILLTENFNTKSSHEKAIKEFAAKNVGKNIY
jgi:hypothetical protein